MKNFILQAGASGEAGQVMPIGNIKITDIDLVGSNGNYTFTKKVDKLKIEAGGEATLSVSKASTSCESGGNAQCSSLSCGDFWIRFAQAHGTAAAD